LLRSFVADYARLFATLAADTLFGSAGNDLATGLPWLTTAPLRSVGAFFVVVGATVAAEDALEQGDGQELCQELNLDPKRIASGQESELEMGFPSFEQHFNLPPTTVGFQHTGSRRSASQLTRLEFPAS
jgi:hypothetical protein